MDSLTTRRARPEAIAEDANRPAPRPGRLVPAARGAVRVAWRTAGAGALGAAAVWAALFEGPLATGAVSWAVAGIVAAVLLVPAGAAALLAWTLGDLLDLPADLREAAASVRSDANGRGVRGLFRTVWAVRGLALGGAGAWTRTAGLVRLASLPFVLGLLGLVALNAVVVVAGVVALVTLVF
ncbi:MAG TPA: hypothetical protein VF576_13750 [Rubricoccaceae bacterium]|jgi:hypothetical protein